VTRFAVSLNLRDRAGAEQLLAQLQDPTSPHYHQWLTSAEFAARMCCDLAAGGW
jgi:subtilase family serine protease